MDPALTHVIQICLGLLLLGAAWGKARDFNTFRYVLADYQVLPAGVVPGVAVVAVLAEAVLGFGWLLAWLPGVGLDVVPVATAALLGLYGCAIVLNLLRSRRFISCGCGFGSTGGEQLSWWLVVRNGVLMVLAASAGWPGSGRVLGMIDVFTVAVTVIAAVLLYAAFHQVLANRIHVDNWRTDLST